jgi:hypothetical protein
MKSLRELRCRNRWARSFRLPYQKSFIGSSSPVSTLRNCRTWCAMIFLVRKSVVFGRIEDEAVHFLFEFSATFRAPSLLMRTPFTLSLVSMLCASAGLHSVRWSGERHRFLWRIHCFKIRSIQNAQIEQRTGERSQMLVRYSSIRSKLKLLLPYSMVWRYLNRGPFLPSRWMNPPIEQQCV